MIPAPPALGLAVQGALVQVTIGLAQAMAAPLVARGQVLPQPETGWAMIDTGASSTCVDDELARRLGLPAIDTVMMASASHASTQQNVYPIHITLVGTPIEVDVPRAMGAVLAPLAAQNIVALIGRDFLANCTLVYNGAVGQITLAI